MSFITAIGTGVPPFRFDQSTIGSFMESTMGKADAVTRRKIKAVFRASGISFRNSVLEDYGKTDDFSFYPNDETSPYPSTDARMKLFREHALPLSKSAVENMLASQPEAVLSDVTHLIVVSCTGLYAPGLDIDLVRTLGLSTNVQRTCIQFMGCYAAFNALKVADAICRSDARQKVLIVCTELCSIHFQHLPSDDNILANALFADGAAAMMVESENNRGKSFEIQTFYNDLALNGAQDMAWNVGDVGFQMRLSSYIPDLIRVEITKLIDALLAKLSIERNDIPFFALHPGGVKILQTIESKLSLSKSEIEDSYSVLRNYGNMSSATVVFVLNEILKKIVPVHNNNNVLSMGFGPGLTLECMLLKIKSQ
jgi:predicted naringenin-chalcone synthase